MITNIFASDTNKPALRKTHEGHDPEKDPELTTSTGTFQLTARWWTCLSKSTLPWLPIYRASILISIQFVLIFVAVARPRGLPAPSSPAKMYSDKAPKPVFMVGAPTKAQSVGSFSNAL
jgi:hypothetical protein